MKINYIQRTLPADMIWWMSEHVCCLIVIGILFWRNCITFYFVVRWNWNRIDRLNVPDVKLYLWNESCWVIFAPLHRVSNLLPVVWFINFDLIIKRTCKLFVRRKLSHRVASPLGIGFSFWFGWDLKVWWHEMLKCFFFCIFWPIIFKWFVGTIAVLIKN